MGDQGAGDAHANLVWDAGQQRILLSYSSEASLPPDLDSVKGNCHCGKVTFTVNVKPAPLIAHDCNCSICAKRGYLHLTIPKERVDIAQDVWANTTTYIFNTGVAKHTFCSTCGVQAIYQPRSNPDCYSINVRCLQLGNIKVPIYLYEGQNYAGALDVK